MINLLDIDQARVSTASDGSVLFDDPAAPWVLRVWTRTPTDGGPTSRRRRSTIVRMRIDARDLQVGITAGRLARLPTAQMLHIAAAAVTADDAHPNEVYYRMLARPKTVGQRGWPNDHWDQVLAVDEWARESGRPGGGARAVADMWGVAVNPTAYRWIAEARRRYTTQEAA